MLIIISPENYSLIPWSIVIGFYHVICKYWFFALLPRDSLLVLAFSCYEFSLWFTNVTLAAISARNVVNGTTRFLETSGLLSDRVWMPLWCPGFPKLSLLAQRSRWRMDLSCTPVRILQMVVMIFKGGLDLLASKMKRLGNLLDCNVDITRYFSLIRSDFVVGRCSVRSIYCWPSLTRKKDTYFGILISVLFILYQKKDSCTSPEEGLWLPPKRQERFFIVNNFRDAFNQQWNLICIFKYF